MREGKDDKNQTKLMIGGYKIKYPGYYGTPMAGLLTVNSYLNRKISTLGSKFVTSDIKNFYINTPMA